MPPMIAVRLPPLNCRDRVLRCDPHQNTVELIVSSSSERLPMLVISDSPTRMIPTGQRISHRCTSRMSSVWSRKNTPTATMARRTEPRPRHGHQRHQADADHGERPPVGDELTNVHVHDVELGGAGR